MQVPSCSTGLGNSAVTSTELGGKKFSAKKPFVKRGNFPVAWHIGSSCVGKVTRPVNLTHKETPINSHWIIKQNNLLWAAKLIICEERQELEHIRDLSPAAPAGRRGKSPFPWVSARLALRGRASLQEAAARPGCCCWPSAAPEGTQRARQRKQRQRDRGGEGSPRSSQRDRARQKNPAGRPPK